MRQPIAKPSAIDWERAHERLRASEQALAESLAESPARVAAAYRRRAAQLAIAGGTTGVEPPEAAAAVLIFSLGQERFAIELHELAEVLPLVLCMPVPGAAAGILGVINLRGELRPIVDLRRLIMRSEDEDANSGFVLLLQRRGRELGLRVDRVAGLGEIARQKVLAAEPGRYAQRIAGETLLLLDVEKVLAAMFPAAGDG
jgi:purine-binding chemotaxis protein CheW